jgi:hypothetical protein
VTAAGVHTPAPGTVPTHAGRPAPPWPRLPALYLASRRIPAALGLLAALGALLWAALHWHWNIAGGPAAQEFFPLVIQSGAAAVIAVTTYGPFGDPERATGRWLPWLRLGAAALLTVTAFGALTAGATGGYLPGGTLALLRNLAGMTGTGLLAAVVLGGAFGWVGPMAYLLLTEAALTQGGWTTPWIWPARPPGDLGAALCASLVFAAGAVAFTLRGARDTAGRD